MASRNGEYISHLVSIRSRVTGSGNFKLTVYSLDGVRSQALMDTTLIELNNRQPTRLANFKETRMQIRFEVIGYNEYFVMGNLIPFIKLSAISYPQTAT